MLAIADVPECADWTYDSLDWYYADNGDNSLMFQVGYLDEVNTCDVQFELKIYTLASPTAAKDDPGSSLYFFGGHSVEAVENATEESGTHNWAASEPGKCSQFDFTIDGVLVSTERVTDDCEELPLTDGDPGDPDPENPDDFTSATPDPDQPGDGDDGSGDGVDQGGELPRTGATSGALVALAAGLTLAGGAALAGSRRRATA